LGEIVTTHDGGSVNCLVDDHLWPWVERTPVLLHHGFARNAQFWRPWVPLLAGERRVYRPELRGCGGSPEPDPKFVFTDESFVTDVVAVLDHFGLPRVHWVGESLGAKIGFLVARARPDRIASIVACEGPLVVPHATVDGMAFGEARASNSIRALGMAGWARQTVGQRLDLDKAPPELVEWYVEEQSRVPDWVGARLLDFVQAVDLRERVRGLAIPTLVIYGERDSMIAHGEAEDQASILGARLELIPGLAHGITVLAAPECARLARAFWRDVEAGPAGA
jgi:pimeloyl-ACP methyl ester carboxylesterase